MPSSPFDMSSAMEAGIPFDQLNPNDQPSASSQEQTNPEPTMPIPATLIKGSPRIDLDDHSPVTLAAIKAQDGQFGMYRLFANARSRVLEYWQEKQYGAILKLDKLDQRSRSRGFNYHKSFRNRGKYGKKRARLMKRLTHYFIVFDKLMAGTKSMTESEKPKKATWDGLQSWSEEILEPEAGFLQAPLDEFRTVGTASVVEKMVDSLTSVTFMRALFKPFHRDAFDGTSFTAHTYDDSIILWLNKVVPHILLAVFVVLPFSILAFSGVSALAGGILLIGFILAFDCLAISINQRRTDVQILLLVGYGACLFSSYNNYWARS